MAKHEYQLLYNFGKLVTCFIVYHSVPATIYGPPNDMIKWRTERYIRTGKVDILPCSLPIRIYIYIYIWHERETIHYKPILGKQDSTRNISSG